MTRKLKVYQTERDDFGRRFVAFEWVTYGIRMAENKEVADEAK